MSLTLRSSLVRTFKYNYCYVGIHSIVMHTALWRHSELVLYVGIKEI